MNDKFKVGDKVQTSGLHDVFDNHVEGIVESINSGMGIIDPTIGVRLFNKSVVVYVNPDSLFYIDGQIDYKKRVVEIQEIIDESYKLTVELHNLLSDKNYSSEAQRLEDILIILSTVSQKVGFIGIKDVDETE